MFQKGVVKKEYRFEARETTVVLLIKIDIILALGSFEDVGI